MIDKLAIERKLMDLNKNIKMLEELRRITFDDLKNSLKDQWAVFYGLQISIQIVIDTGNHILAALQENQVEEYADIIDKLGIKKIIPEEFAKRIRGMAGLRNLLVHEYGIINVEKIFYVLQNDIDDFQEFKNYIIKYLDLNI
ncbi:MAG: DUF86 domain-containing protein [Actinobacteria bacterium]|nr:DUF86 domain-containing protein [Actinomycetota bacterium]